MKKDLSEQTNTFTSKFIFFLALDKEWEGSGAKEIYFCCGSDFWNFVRIEYSPSNDDFELSHSEEWERILPHMRTPQN